MTYRSVLKRVLDIYGLDYDTIENYQKGYRNEIWPVRLTDGQTINVTFYKREPDILRRVHHADNVSEYLAQHGMPTRRRIDTRTLHLMSSIGSTYVGIYNYLPGSTIPWEAYKKIHIKLLGKAMSDMHYLLKDAPTNGLISVYTECLNLLKLMGCYFEDPQVRNAMRQKLMIDLTVNFVHFEHLFKEYRKKTIDQQVLHMDFVRGNILFDTASDVYPYSFDDVAISGILDFEKVAVGHTVVDVARTLAFLLVDCKYKRSDKINKYFLYSGYLKRGSGGRIGGETPRELFVTFFLFYDFYKFLRHNPYESLAFNEHYIRTRDILLTRSMLSYV